MENLMLYLFLSLIIFISALKFLVKPSINLPPSPPFSLPIIGHLYLLKRPIHQTLQKLSKKYGHVFSLRLGSQLVVVVSSPSAVKECFTVNDITLANRPQTNITKHLTYNNTIFSASSYGDHWRDLRRISTIEIFSTTRLNMFLEIRKDEIKRLLGKLCGISSDDFASVEMGSMFSKLSSNIVMRMVTGKRFYGEDVLDAEQAKEFRDIVKQVMENCGSYDSSSILLLNWIDITGYEKRIIELGQRNDQFLQGLIDEHRNQKEEGRNTMIDHLLSLQESQLDCMSDQVIKGLIMVILLAGTDTVAVTMEWALSHLLNNPDVLNNARIELDSIVGQGQLVDESDLSKLSYLQGIIYETLRLNPAAPLLVPHYASKNCSIAGYEIPRDTMILINAWAIHRDPNIWEDATTFEPKRYKNRNVDELLYKLIPFGVGRRACPGVGMAHRVVGLALASLIQCFEWKRVNRELVDMAEGVGLTMPRAHPLQAMCKSRPIMERVFI
ncbi:cytochrome P450 81Q32-like [Benincasa hispida]|uniref:cytochrome P450 81Q32-like n=1 Tax=Benincasa hispida TaxID=102211 RepID=UPI001902B126|nr:cytochrome P450 81Q32-like [Benincasa hispida]